MWYALRDARAGQALSWPLRRLLQATGAVLLRLGGRRGDLWLRTHEAELLSAGMPPHGLVPAAGVRSERGLRDRRFVLRHFVFQSLFLLSSKRWWCTWVAPRRIRTPSLPLRSARPPPRAPLVCSHRCERPPAPHACSTRLAALRVCCWDWRCGDSMCNCCPGEPAAKPPLSRQAPMKV